MARARFYDIKRVEQQPLPTAPPTPHLPVDYGAGVPNSYTGNDYRNRMPFHFVDKNTGEEFYGWQYGQTMELFVTFEGEPELEEQPYVTDVLRTTENVEGSTKSIVDKETKIANLEVGTMAFTDASIYPKKTYFSSRITKLMIRLNLMRSTAVQALNLLEKMASEMSKGDEMNSKLIEELQHQIVVLKDTLNSRIDGVEKKLDKEITRLEQKITDGLSELDSKIGESHDKFTIEKSWEFTQAIWEADKGYWSIEKPLPITDAAEYDITPTVLIKETNKEDDSVSYHTDTSFTWYLKNKNVIVITAKQKENGILSVYVTKKAS